MAKITVNGLEHDWGQVSMVYYEDLVALAILADLKIASEPVITLNGNRVRPNSGVDVQDGQEFIIEVQTDGDSD